MKNLNLEYSLNDETEVKLWYQTNYYKHICLGNWTMSFTGNFKSKMESIFKFVDRYIKLYFPNFYFDSIEKELYMLNSLI